MNYFFKNFPTVDYDIKKNGKKITVPNITASMKIQDLVRRKKAVFYNYNVPEGERADAIAFKYYGDASLDWVIFLTNQYIDPQFDWPLDRRSFENYLTDKYGSVRLASSTIHHYEQILQEQSVNFDGTVVPEIYIEIDLDTYNSLDIAERRTVYCYEYEQRINDAKREIKLLDERYVIELVGQAQEVFNR